MLLYWRKPASSSCGAGWNVEWNKVADLISPCYYLAFAECPLEILVELKKVCTYFPYFSFNAGQRRAISDLGVY